MTTVNYEAKDRFLSRPGDIELGRTFNAMRRARREREWEAYLLNRQMANCLAPWSRHPSLLDSLIGKGLV